MLASLVLCREGARGGGVGVGVCGLTPDVAAFAARIAARRSFRIPVLPVGRGVDAIVVTVEAGLAGNRDPLALTLLGPVAREDDACGVGGRSTDIRSTDVLESAGDAALLPLATPLTVRAVFFTGDTFDFSGFASSLPSLSSELPRARFRFPFSRGADGGGIERTSCKAVFSPFSGFFMSPGTLSAMNASIVLVTLLFARTSECF